MKRGKRPRTEDESDGEDEQKVEQVTKRPKKVAAIMQNPQEESPETQSRAWEIETSEEELN
jgi:hypothetical protein